MIFISCESDETRENFQSSKSFEEIKEEVEKEKVQATKKRKERIQKGDTIALDYKTLRDFLPKEIDGYTPEGQIIASEQNKSGQAFSNVEQSYQKEGKHLLIALIDYSSSNSKFSEEVAFWNSGLRINNQSVVAGGVEVGDYKGWEIYEKKTKVAKLDLALSDRILLKLTASHQKNTHYLKKVVNQINLKKLSNY